MKIALAQIRPEAGQIDRNIDKHLRCIDMVSSENSELILFPELSLTGYEPKLSEELSLEANDTRLEVFQKASDQRPMTIAIGAPIKKDGAVLITMIIFRPEQNPMYYSKRFLHVDELPFFKAGSKQILWKQNDMTLAPAICYESRILQHALDVAKLGVDIYLASVAKPQHGLEKAEKHYSEIARKYGWTVLMANSVGPSDNFTSAGKSGVWLPDGSVLSQLSETEEALLIYDSNNQKTTTKKL